VINSHELTMRHVPYPLTGAFIISNAVIKA